MSDQVLLAQNLEVEALREGKDIAQKHLHLPLVRLDVSQFVEVSSYLVGLVVNVL